MKAEIGSEGRSSPGGPAADVIDFSLIVRGLAALQVVVWHTSAYSLAGGLWDYVSVSGRQCVWIFFVLSGYFVSHGFFSGRYHLRRRDIVDYSLARTLRIVPLYAFVTVLMFVLLRAVPTSNRLDYGVLDWQALVGALLFIPRATTFPTVFWTLVIEMKFYLLVPAIFALHRYADRRLGSQISIIVLLLVIYGVLSLVSERMASMYQLSLDNRTLLGNGSHFLAGVAVHDLVRFGPIRRFLSRSHAVWWLGGVALVALLTSTNWYHTLPDRHFWTYGSILTDVAAVSLLLIHRRLEERSVRRGTAGLVLGGLGTIAYGLYAWHAVLLTALPALLGHLWVVTAASGALAVVSYRLLERPALRLRRRLIHRSFLGGGSAIV